MVTDVTSSPLHKSFWANVDMSGVHPGGSVLLTLEHDDEDGSIASFRLERRWKWPSRDAKDG